VVSSTAFKPVRVVFIGEPRLSKGRMQNKIRNYFENRRQTIEIEFMTANIYDCAETIEVLEKAVEKYPDCVIDVTGGRDLVLLAVGMFCSRNAVPLLRFCKATNEFINIRNCDFIVDKYFTEKISLEQFIILTGGSLLGHGHFNPDKILQETLDDIERAWDVFLKFKKQWSRQVQYLQMVSKPEEGTCEKMNISAPLQFKLPKADILKCNSEIMLHLGLLGLLNDTKISDGIISFKYKNLDIRRCLTDAGGWLELYIYKEAKESGLFDNADLNVVVDWNGIEHERDNVINEIDVVLTKGITPILISCKAGNFDAKDLNEFRAVASRFGGDNAAAVFVTTNPIMETAPWIYKRAVEFGIEIIEYNDLIEGKLIERLSKIAKNTYYN